MSTVYFFLLVSSILLSTLIIVIAVAKAFFVFKHTDNLYSVKIPKILKLLRLFKDDETILIRITEILNENNNIIIMIN
jgi:hypothetical protein